MPQPSRAGLDLADRRGDKIVGSLLLATAPREVEGLRKRVPPHARKKRGEGSTVVHGRCERRD
jgi:hypothetical protein